MKSSKDKKIFNSEFSVLQQFKSAERQRAGARKSYWIKNLKN
jgi:hypothetical protein